MDGQEIRLLRRRLGLTQFDLTAALNVDQGTVSRRERNAESPRPAKLAALRDLLLKEPVCRSQARLHAYLAHNLYSAMAMNRHGRISGFSGLCRDHYRDRHGVDVTGHLGDSFARHCAIIGREPLLSLLNQSGIARGEALFLRIHSNIRGIASCNIFEPLFESGEFAGYLGYLAGRVRIRPNDEVTVEKVELIRTDAPDDLVILHAGARAGEMRPSGMAF